MMLELTNLLLNTKFTKEEIETEREKEREVEKEITCETKVGDDGKCYLVIHRTSGNSEWYDMFKNWGEKFKKYAENQKEEIEKLQNSDDIIRRMLDYDE